MSTNAPFGGKPSSAGNKNKLQTKATVSGGKKKGVEEDPQQAQQEKLRKFLSTMLPRDYGEHVRPRITVSHAQQLVIGSKELLSDDHHPPPQVPLTPGELPERIHLLKKYFTQHPISSVKAQIEEVEPADVAPEPEFTLEEEEEDEELMDAPKLQDQSPSVSPGAQGLVNILAMQRAKKAFVKRRENNASLFSCLRKPKPTEQDENKRNKAGLLPSALRDLVALNRQYSVKRSDYVNVTEYERAMEREDCLATDILVDGGIPPKLQAAAMRAKSRRQRRKHRSMSISSLSSSGSEKQRSRARRLSAGSTTSFDPEDVKVPLPSILEEEYVPFELPKNARTRRWQKGKGVEYGKILLEQMDNRNVACGEVLLCDETTKDERSRRTCTRDAHPTVSLLEAMQMARQTHLIAPARGEGGLIGVDQHPGGDQPDGHRKVSLFNESFVSTSSGGGFGVNIDDLAARRGSSPMDPLVPELMKMPTAGTWKFGDLATSNELGSETSRGGHDDAVSISDLASHRSPTKSIHPSVTPRSPVKSPLSARILAVPEQRYALGDVHTTTAIPREVSNRQLQRRMSQAPRFVETPLKDFGKKVKKRKGPTVSSSKTPLPTFGRKYSEDSDNMSLLPPRRAITPGYSDVPPSCRDDSYKELQQRRKRFHQVTPSERVAAALPMAFRKL